MKDLKNIAKMLGIAVWVLGGIGGFAYCCYYGQYLIAAAVLALAAMAFPTVKKWWPKKDAE